jgi:hypothetical protein
LIQSDENLLLGSQKSTLLSSKQFLGLRSDGTLGLQGKFASVKSGSQLNLQAGLINLNGASAASIPEVPNIQNVRLPDTEFFTGRGWVSVPEQLETIVSRAPTHEPFVGHGQGANVSVNLNPIPVVIPDAGTAANEIYETVSTQPVQRGVTLEQVVVESVSPVTAGTLTADQITVMNAQTAANVSALYPAYDDNRQLYPGFELDENNNPVYVGPELGSASRGVGVYAQSTTALVSSGLVNPAALTLIQTGVSPRTVLESAANWTGQFGVNSLTDYLNNRTLQNVVQIGLLVAAYQGLTDRGVLKGNEPPRYVATFVQPATTYGVDAVTQWVDGFADSEQIDALTVAARQGQYAIDFVEAYGEEYNFLDTVPTGPFEANRDEIDQIVANIIGNPKVPVPQYTETPAVVEVTTEGTPVIQPDDTIVRVPVTVVNTQENGLFRLAPGYKRG